MTTAAQAEPTVGGERRRAVRPGSPRPGRTRGRLTAAVTVAAALLLSLLAATASPVAAQSRIWHVGPNGDDGNPGTARQPLASVYRAGELASPGDTIRLLPGTYRPDEGGFWLGHGGRPGAPITVDAAPRAVVSIVSSGGRFCLGTDADWVVFRNLRCSGDLGIASVDASHVTFDRLQVSDLGAPAAAGIAAYAVDESISDITMTRNRVSNVSGTGLAVGANRIGAVDDVLVANNVVRDTNTDFVSPEFKGGWGSGIAVGGSTDAVIRNNDVRRTYGEAFNCALSRRCTVTGNVAVDAYNVLFYADNTADSRWEGNRGWTTGDPRFTRDYGGGPTVASGVQMANEDSWFSGPGIPVSGNVVRNNTFRHVTIGFAYGLYENFTAGIRNTVVTGNRFLQVYLCGISLADRPENTGNVIEPNRITLRPGAQAVCR